MSPLSCQGSLDGNKVATFTRDIRGVSNLRISTNPISGFHCFILWGRIVRAEQTQQTARKQGHIAALKCCPGCRVYVHRKSKMQDQQSLISALDKESPSNGTQESNRFWRQAKHFSPHVLSQ